jgi:hypothetical protein
MSAVRPPHSTDLLAEEIGLALLAEGRLDHPGARRADRSGIGEREIARASGRVLVDAISEGTPPPCV